MGLSKYYTKHNTTYGRQFRQTVCHNFGCSIIHGFFKFTADYVIRNAPLKPEFRVGKEGGTLTTPSSQFSIAFPLYQKWVKAVHYTITKKRQYCETSISLCGFLGFQPKMMYCAIISWCLLTILKPTMNPSTNNYITVSFSTTPLRGRNNSHWNKKTKPECVEHVILFCCSC